VHSLSRGFQAKNFGLYFDFAQFLCAVLYTGQRVGCMKWNGMVIDELRRMWNVAVVV
jgi:hypothetical protein